MEYLFELTVSRDALNLDLEETFHDARDQFRASEIAREMELAYTVDSDGDAIDLSVRGPQVQIVPLLRALVAEQIVGEVTVLDGDGEYIADFLFGDGTEEAALAALPAGRE